ncbi:MAG: hypothetical protein JNL38_38445 [Myxococcales bacterium]|nr:hypothetical protein [Myxococcales bacterium]
MLKRRAFLLGTLTAAVSCQRPGGDEPAAPKMAPATLAGRIADVKAGKVAVLYVGPDALFKRGRVPGAVNVGEAGSSAGLAAIKAAIAKLPPETEVVLYCGCCPVASCPNVRPAGAAVRAARPNNGYVLDLPTRFADDWADKGYPTERG